MVAWAQHLSRLAMRDRRYQERIADYRFTQHPAVQMVCECGRIPKHETISFKIAAGGKWLRFRCAKCEKHYHIIGVPDVDTVTTAWGSCKQEGFFKGAQCNTGLCSTHGGGKKCEKEGCDKGAQCNTGLCIAHGGGKKCEKEGCDKGALGRTCLCGAHGGGQRCEKEGCGKGAQGNTGFCSAHGGGKKH
jgi:hypothetical protein